MPNLRHYLYADPVALASLYADALPDEGTGVAYFGAFEQQLAAAGHVLDLSVTSQTASLRNAATRQRLARSLCVRVTGRAVLDDFVALRKRLGQFGWRF